MPESEKSTHSRKPRNFRGELDEAGVTAEQVRNRLSAYAMTINARTRPVVLRGAARFTHWYEGEDDPTEYAETHGLTRSGMQANIRRLSRVAIDATYDNAAHGDLIEDALLSLPPPPEPRLTLGGVVEDEKEEIELGVSWRDAANCLGTDPDEFFPETGAVSSEIEALCKNCDVVKQCLRYALQNNEKFGYWGGTSANERRQLKRSASV